MNPFNIALITLHTGVSGTGGQVSRVTGFKLKFSSKLFDIYYVPPIVSPHGNTFLFFFFFIKKKQEVKFEKMVYLWRNRTPIPSESLDLDFNQVKEELKKQIFTELKEFNSNLNNLDNLTKLDHSCLPTYRSCEPLLNIISIAGKNSISFFFFGFSCTFLYLLLFNNNSENLNLCFKQPFSQLKYEAFEIELKKSMGIGNSQKKNKNLKKLFSNFDFFQPNFMLSSEFCYNLYKNQKERENGFSYEEITFYFVMRRSEIIIKLKKVAFICYRIFLSQVSFWVISYFVSIPLFWLEEYSKSKILIPMIGISLLKNKWTACFFAGIFWYFIGKMIDKVLPLIITNTEGIIIISIEQFPKIGKYFEKIKKPFSKIGKEKPYRKPMYGFEMLEYLI